MFKRREKPSQAQKLREMIWPSMGWRRMAQYTRLRLIRLPDTTHKIALGLALGSAVSFSPLIGTHFAQALFLAWIFRVNMLASFIGTAIGNPWTFAFIWWSSFALGTGIFEFFGWHDAGTLPDHIDFDVVMEILKTHPLDIFLPWMVGGYLIGMAILLPAYYLYYWMIQAGRIARQKVLARKILTKAKQL